MSDILLKEVQKLEDKLNQLPLNLIDAIYIIDVDTLKFNYITQTFEQISGYSYHEILDFSLEELLTPDSFIKVRKILIDGKRKFKAGIKIIAREKLEFARKDGSTYWIEFKAKYVKDKNNVLKIVGIAREITQQMKQDQMQTDIITQLKDILAEKEVLLKENRVLKELLPICSGCKRIRDSKNNWWPLDLYLSKKVDKKITPFVCNECQIIGFGSNLFKR